MDEEQQATAKAAAKKAKKLRQKQDKQQKQIADLISPLQHGLPAAEAAADECLLSTSPLLAHATTDASPLLSLFDSQRLSPLSKHCMSPLSGQPVNISTLFAQPTSDASPILHLFDSQRIRPMLGQGVSPLSG